MIGRSVLLASLLIAPVLAGTAGAAPHGGACQLSGKAVFKNGPSNSTHAFTYTFTGTLANCGSSASAPQGGTIGTVAPAKGNGTCANGTTVGVALVKWTDATTSVISYTTQSAGAEVVLQGTVVPSYRVGKTTYRSTRFAGDSALGELAFQANPQECTGNGVTTAPIAGVTGIGRSA